MKKIIVLLAGAVLLIAYFILQDDGSIVAPQSESAGSVTTDTLVLEEISHAPVANDADNLPQEHPQTQPQSGIDKRLEPEIRDAVIEHVNTSHEGLVEEETDQGVEMKLQGRFRTAPVATVDEKGEVIVRDYTAPPVK